MVVVQHELIALAHFISFLLLPTETEIFLPTKVQETLVLMPLVAIPVMVVEYEILHLLTMLFSSSSNFNT